MEWCRSGREQVEQIQYSKFAHDNFRYVENNCTNEQNQTTEWQNHFDDANCEYQEPQHTEDGTKEKFRQSNLKEEKFGQSNLILIVNCNVKYLCVDVYKLFQNKAEIVSCLWSTNTKQTITEGDVEMENKTIIWWWKWIAQWLEGLSCSFSLSKIYTAKNTVFFFQIDLAFFSFFFLIWVKNTFFGPKKDMRVT